MPLLPLRQEALCPGVAVHAIVQSMGLIELFYHLLYLNPFNLGKQTINIKLNY